MKKRLRLQKVTLRNLDDKATGELAGGILPTGCYWTCGTCGTCISCPVTICACTATCVTCNTKCGQQTCGAECGGSPGGGS